MSKWPETARWTENDVSYKGGSNKERIDFSVARAMNLLTDPDKKKRREQGLCSWCYYDGGRMAGQAFTDWNCRACLKDQPAWPNTGHPLICDQCCKRHTLCRECGADLFLRVRRNNTISLPKEHP